MQNRKDISSELLEISQLIAEINVSKNPFEVPSGYFELLPDRIMERIKTAYAGSVKNELEALSPVISQIEKNNITYVVPENYFESFPGLLLSRIKAEDATSVSEELSILSPLLSRADKKNPFSTPSGYFNELSDNLVEGVKAIEFVKDELEQLSPLMGGLSKKNVYTVPGEYFDTLAENILQRIKHAQEKAKVVAFRKNRPWLKYAIAATLTGIILTIGFFTFNKQNKTTEDPLAALSKVSDQEINNYLDNHDIPLTEMPNTNTPVLDFNENDITDLLADVSDNELEQYQYDNDQTGAKDLITN